MLSSWVPVTGLQVRSGDEVAIQQTDNSGRHESAGDLLPPFPAGNLKVRISPGQQYPVLTCSESEESGTTSCRNPSTAESLAGSPYIVVLCFRCDPLPSAFRQVPSDRWFCREIPPGNLRGRSNLDGLIMLRRRWGQYDAYRPKCFFFAMHSGVHAIRQAMPNPAAHVSETAERRRKTEVPFGAPHDV